MTAIFRYDIKKETKTDEVPREAIDMVSTIVNRPATRLPNTYVRSFVCLLFFCMPQYSLSVAQDKF